MPPLPARDQICDVMVSVLTLGVVDLIWFIVFNADSAIFQLYHGDQF